jgi:hypothetical protein
MDRDLADSFAFAVDPQGSLAGGEADVVDIEADDLADLRASVERGESKGLVARRRAGLDGPQVAQLVSLAEGTRCRCRQVEPGGAGCSEVAADVEVGDRGERVVDRRGAAFEDGLEVGAVVAHSPVAAVAGVERVAVGLRRGEPGEVLANL